MYRDTGAGKDPVPPAQMAMALLLQGYLGLSDGDALEATLLDLRWQLVLDCLGATDPPFSQGTLQGFRERLIAHDMDRRVLERTVELAKRTRELIGRSYRKHWGWPSTRLRSRGPVESRTPSTCWRMRGSKLVESAAALLHWSPERVCQEAGAPLLLAPSIKAALDRDWSDPAQKASAAKRLVIELENLKDWIAAKLPEELKKPPLLEDVATLNQIMDQDLEPDPGGGGMKIRKGVAEDRRVSVEDPEMRHGRKSKTKRFNGFKRHIATDLDSGLILSGAITAANQPEESAARDLAEDIVRQGFSVGDLHLDRGYIKSPLVDEILGRGGEIVCRPWVAHNGKAFSKAAFKLNMRDLTITCPAGESERIRSSVVEFDPDACDPCPLRAKCTTAEMGSGRTVNI